MFVCVQYFGRRSLKVLYESVWIWTMLMMLMLIVEDVKHSGMRWTQVYTSIHFTVG